MHAISGRWIANLAKSQRHANHQFRSAALELVVTDQTVTIVHSGVNMAGRFEEGTTELRPDGVAHPAAPQAPDVLVVTSWRGARRLETVATRHGTAAGAGVYEVSEDGLTLTATVSGTDAAGAAFEQRIVFDRAPPVDGFMEAAIAEAETGLGEGGIPIGSVLVARGEILARGHNRRVQQSSAIRHAEMDALEQAGRLAAAVYAESVLYTTLSPCAMCAGAILLYRIPRVVIGEHVTFVGEEALLRSRGVAVDIVHERRCIAMMQGFIDRHPALWNEDIGV